MVQHRVQKEALSVLHKYMMYVFHNVLGITFARISRKIFYFHTLQANASLRFFHILQANTSLHCMPVKTDCKAYIGQRNIQRRMFYISNVAEIDV